MLCYYYNFRDALDGCDIQWKYKGVLAFIACYSITPKTINENFVAV
jgi:hypothetical protein